MQVLLSVLTLFDDEIINTCRDRRADMDKMVLEAGVVSGLRNKLFRFILLPSKAKVIVAILLAHRCTILEKYRNPNEMQRSSSWANNYNLAGLV